MILEKTKITTIFKNNQKISNLVCQFRKNPVGLSCV